jgi:hypothetical protein
MENQDDTSIVLDGVIHGVVFSGDLSDAERSAQGFPPKGTKCACSKCSCENEADVGSVEHPICGCCLADCPDVHPDAEIGNRPSSGKSKTPAM